MSGKPWYKRYPGDFLGATLHLNLEQKGALSVCLDLIYQNGGPIPDDPRWIARACGCSVRKWKSILSQLVAHGDLQCENGFIFNFRARKQLENCAKSEDKTPEKSIKSEDKTAEKTPVLNEINDLAEKKQPEKEPLPHARVKNQIPDTRYQKEKNKQKTNGANAPNDDGDFYFSSGVIRLTKADYDRWQHAFPHLALSGALESLSDWAGKQKSWFPAVAGALAKRNQEAYQRLMAEKVRFPDFGEQAKETAPDGREFNPRTHHWDADLQAVTKRMGPVG